MQAINAEGTFRARLDSRDSLNRLQAGTGTVSTSATATTSGGSGSTLDLAAGLKITNGGVTTALDFSQAVSVQDFLNIFNASELGLHAELNTDSSGINVKSRLSGGDF